MIDIGDLAPDFTGVLTNGHPWSLREQQGKQHVILYFFPKDFTPGCTREACSFRDQYPDISALDAVVIGVSTDTPETHAQFAATHHLPYPLISDVDGRIANAYGVARFKGWLPTKRVTFVIDKSGTVRQIIHSEFNIERHIDEALDTERQLEGTPAATTP